MDDYTKAVRSFSALKSYCEQEHFKGWDPYDGLNSKVFQAIPFLKKSALCRLIVIQGFKRCPINLRKLALVPKEYNAKGIGLFLSGYCNLYNVVEKHPEWKKLLGTLDEIKTRINELADCLLDFVHREIITGLVGDTILIGRRRLFLLRNIPLVVATNLCHGSDGGL